MARAAGLTVRTLHHYDEIGLVGASERTASGHRRYTEADLRRLYRVLALRQLGLSLPEIATALDRSADELTTLRDLLATQLVELDADAERLTRLRHKLVELLERLDASAMPDPDQFMTTLELLPLVERYLTPAQRDDLARRRLELGREAIEALQSEWGALVGELTRHLRAGTPVDDPRVQALTTRWDEIGTAFHDGDESITAAVDTMWREHRADLSRRIGWSAPTDGPDLVDYVQRARQARRGR
jgi:DNA-binding transcriptional MerR regulator